MFSHPSRAMCCLRQRGLYFARRPGFRCCSSARNLLNSRLLYASLPGFSFLLACAVPALPRLSVAACLSIALFYAAALFLSEGRGSG